MGGCGYRNQSFVGKFQSYTKKLKRLQSLLYQGISWF